MVRLVLVDDHVTLRQGLRVLLEKQSNIRVVGEAGTGQEACNVALRCQPDLILLDLKLPDTKPAELCPELRKLSPHSKILILSGVEEAEPIYQAVDSGIDGYALKAGDSAELVTAINQVMEGSSYLHPKITRLILHRTGQSFATNSSKSSPKTNAGSATLTKRQRQVLMLMASTATNKDIAERLVISEETVRSHVKSILKKMGQTNRTQAVVEAVRTGIISI